MATQLGSPPVWHDAQGEPLTCRSKIRLLNEALEELKVMAQDAYEDAILMGVEPSQIERELEAVVRQLNNPYQDKAAGHAA